ncbi:Histidine kinase [Sphingobacterium nematocida]|uniref:Histidine kinase n=1 Tax=Sphingobacterium nematocida TaxID=1513896 RepID=A0A1T5F692_9SPHI|nr:histidine kinase [Sphingobacterium nematocida]SKB91630.1 Histidine kinase [Sphingobacterium nematocida]
MRNILYLLLFTVLLSCQKKLEKKDVSPTQLLEQLKQEAKGIVNNDSDSNIVFWNQMLNRSVYNQQNASLAYIHYELAKAYAKTDLTKSKTHIETALGLIEKETDFFDIKVSIYNGLANIYLIEGKTFQSNHYYNKAAALITAHPDKIEPNAQIICLVNCAQENFNSSQVEKASEQNYLALHTATKNKGDLEEYFYHNNLFRIYTQLFRIYEHAGQLDSLKLYNQKVGEIYKILNNDKVQRFYYEQKAIIYTEEQQLDSAIIYTKKCEALDKRSYAETKLGIHQLNLYKDYTNLITLHALSEQFYSAEKYIQAAQEIEETSSVNYSSKFNNRMAQAQYYLQKRNLDAYRKLHLESLAIKDALQASNSAKAIAEISVFYDVEAKKKSISQLNETVAATNEKLATRTLLLIISGLLFLIVIGFISFYVYVHRQRNRLEAKEKMLLQQKLLRTQMEPHFIFNTLSSLQSFIRFEEKEKSIKYLKLFSKLLRSSLEMSRNDYISLEDELEAIKNYLALQQMRLNHNFEFDILIADDIFGAMIPPMLIQPFVENAVIHGVTPLKEKGEIHIRIDLDDHFITVAILDNGKGSNKPSGHTSLSGSIAKERMELLFKETSKKGTIQITQTPNSYLVVLTIPYKTT